MTTDKQFLAKCCKVSDLARKFQHQIQELADLFTERYGATHSDINREDLVDVFEYGHGSMTLEEIDDVMLQEGVPCS